MRTYKLNNFGVLLWVLALFTVSILLLHFFVGMTWIDYVMITAMLAISLISIYTSMTKGLLFTFLVTLMYGVWVIFSGTMDLEPKVDISYYHLIIPTGLAVCFGMVNMLNQRVLRASQDFEAEYDALIRVDSLTGFRNKNDYYTHLEEEINRKNRYGHDLSLMLIHIESFDELNHLYGLHEGNRFLKHLSELIIELTRNVDKHYRVEDQLIAILLPNTDLTGAKILKNRFTDALENMNIVVKGNQQRMDINIEIECAMYQKQWHAQKFHDIALDQLTIKPKGGVK